MLLLLLRFISAAVIDLSPEEAYYWNYSIHPNLSYLDHPPMVAWVIRVGTLWLGKTEIGVRIGGLLLTIVSTWLLNVLGCLWFGRRAGLWAALLFQVIPLYFVYGVIITPDIPLFCFWLLTLYLISIAVLKNQRWTWYAAGVALGLAMLSKYTALFLVPSALFFLIADRGHRKWLLRKEPYLGFLLSIVVFSPVIAWNYQHQWASFAFQFGARLLDVENGHARHSFMQFLGIQLGGIFPTLLAGLLLSLTVALYRITKGGGSRWRFCLFFSFPILGFFTAYSIGSPVKANWPLPGYLPLLLAAYPSYRYLRFKSTQTLAVAYRKTLSFSLYLLPSLYLLALFHMVLTIPYVPVNKWITGWKELGKIVEGEKVAMETETHKKAFVLGMDRNYVVSEMAFYTENSHDVIPRTLLGKKALAFEFWESETLPAGANVVAVGRLFPKLSLLRSHFRNVDQEVTVVQITRHGKIVRRFYLVRCYDYLGKQATIDTQRNHVRCEGQCVISPLATLKARQIFQTFIIDNVDM